MQFKKISETRFADPVTALELSDQYVCHGSAMGRLAFYQINESRELILSDSQPELVRGISYSDDGEFIYISVGDFSCQKLKAYDLSLADEAWIVDTESRDHKANCERAFTLLHQEFNCVITIKMPAKD